MRLYGVCSVTFRGPDEAGLVPKWYPNLHARPRRDDDAARMTKVFDASVGDLPVREIEQ